MKNREQRRGGLVARDWLVLGIGSAIVVVLVAFVAVRMNRNRTQPTTAAAPQPAAVNTDEASVRRVKPADLRAAMQRGNVIVIDVRDLDSYAAGHIPGAMHIPLSFMETQVPYIPRNKAVVTYCT